MAFGGLCNKPSRTSPENKQAHKQTNSRRFFNQKSPRFVLQETNYFFSRTWITLTTTDWSGGQGLSQGPRLKNFLFGNLEQKLHQSRALSWMVTNSPIRSSILKLRARQEPWWRETELSEQQLKELIWGSEVNNDARHSCYPDSPMMPCSSTIWTVLVPPRVLM